MTREKVFENGTSFCRHERKINSKSNLEHIHELANLAMCREMVVVDGMLAGAVFKVGTGEARSGSWERMVPVCGNAWHLQLSSAGVMVCLGPIPLCATSTWRAGWKW